MGRRRRGGGKPIFKIDGKSGPKNIFAHALKNTPSSNSTNLVIPYDYNLGGFNTSKSNSARFRGFVTRRELDQVVKELSGIVTWYRVSKYGFIVPDVCFGLFCVIGLILAIVGNFLRSNQFSAIDFLGGSFVGYLFWCFGQAIYGCKLNAREKDVRAFFDLLNPIWAPRGMQWSTGDYGAYLKLTYNEEFQDASNQNLGVYQVGATGGRDPGSTVRRPMINNDGRLVSVPVPVQGGVWVLCLRVNSRRGN